MVEWLTESGQLLITELLLSAKREYCLANTCFRTITTLSLKRFRITDSVYHTNIQECAILIRADVWEQVSGEGCIISSTPQRRGEKYV
jgi:hypothetical protein